MLIYEDKFYGTPEQGDIELFHFCVSNDLPKEGRRYFAGAYANFCISVDESNR